MSDIKTVCVTGAAGQIGYSLLPLIAKGGIFGSEQLVKLVLFDLPDFENKMKGIELELQDLGSPVLGGTVVAVSPDVAFKDADVIICLAGLARLSVDTTRGDLMRTNKKIYEEHGKAIDQHAKKTCKVLVVANPDNTMALVLSKNAPSIPRENFSSMNRLDQNRAQTTIARKLGIIPQDVEGVIIWGNHSNSMVPDYSHCYAKIDKERHKVTDLIKDQEFWTSYVPDIRRRGYVVLELRKNTSALSPANAAVEHLRDWIYGTPKGHYASMGVYSNGSYGVPRDVFFSFPCVCKDGKYTIVDNLTLTDDVKSMLKTTGEELLQEKEQAAV